MSFAFALVRAGARYSYRLAQKPFVKVGELFREPTSDAEAAADRADYYASMLQIAYKYYEKADLKTQKYLDRWQWEFGYEVIPSTEFSDPDVIKLVQSPSRQVVPLRRIRAWSPVNPSHTGSDPDDIVVLLRGTCSFTDFLDDLRILCEVLCTSKRFKDTEKLVKELVDQQVKKYGRHSIRIVGHSLGAAIGFIIARRLHLEHPSRSPEGHFFNLPFMDIDRLYNMALGMFEVKVALLNAAKIIIHGSPLGGLIGPIAKTVLRKETVEEFAKLKSFKPTIYLNEYDRVCEGYISYFRNRSLYGNCSSGTTKMTAALSIVGCDIRSEHMCPSATLIISKKSFCTLRSHRLKKWIDVDAVSLKVEHHFS